MIAAQVAHYAPTYITICEIQVQQHFACPSQHILASCAIILACVWRRAFDPHCNRRPGHARQGEHVSVRAQHVRLACTTTTVIHPHSVSRVLPAAFQTMQAVELAMEPANWALTGRRGVWTNHPVKSALLGRPILTATLVPAVRTAPQASFQ